VSGTARRSLEAGSRLLAEVASQSADGVEALAARMAEVFRAGGRVLACGNGGSAADAQHVVCELSGRFYLDRPPLDAVALTTNPSVVTAIANDYGYDEVFARQVRAHGRRGDVLLLFTTSGRSASVARARDAATEIGLLTVAFTGAGGEAFAATCDVGFAVPATDTPRIQEAHIALGHALCQCTEALLFGDQGAPPER
jgi:D-sedoheptulose 7-phosphate isomerase